MVHHIFMTIFAVVPLALGGRSDGGTGYDLLKVTSEARKDIAWKKATFLAAAKGDADTIAALAAPEAEDRARPDRFPATTRARQSRQAKLAADRDDQNKMSPAHEDISKLGEDIPKPGAVGAIREWVDWLFSSAPDELLFSGNADPATAAALGVTTGKVSASGSSPPDLSKPGPAAALWGWADRLIPSVPGVWLVSGARDHTSAEPLDAGTRKVSAHRPSTPETTQGEAAALVEEKAIYDKETAQGQAAALVEEKATTLRFSSGGGVEAQRPKARPELNGLGDPTWQAPTPHFSPGDRVEAQGLKARPGLNGQLGEVQSSLQEGRYAVKFEIGDPVRLRAGNLKAAEYFSDGDWVVRDEFSEKGQVATWDDEKECNQVWFPSSGYDCIPPKNLKAAEKETRQMKAERKSTTNGGGQKKTSRSSIGKEGSARQMRVRADIGNDEQFADTGHVKVTTEPRCDADYEVVSISGCEVTADQKSRTGFHMYEETCEVSLTEQGEEMMEVEELKLFTEEGRIAMEAGEWKPEEGLYKLRYDSLDVENEKDCQPVLERAA